MANFKFSLYLDTRYKNNNPELLGKYEVKVRITSLATNRPKLIKTNVFLEKNIFYGLFPHYAPKKIRSKKVFIDSMNAINSNKENAILKEKIEAEFKEWKNADTPETRTIEQLKGNKGFIVGSILLKDWVENYNKKNVSESQKEKVLSAYKKINDYFNRNATDGIPHKNITLYDITPDLLKDWEKWCLDVKGHPYSTQIGYAQNIRTVIKLAIGSPDCSYNKSNYPFYLANENPKGYIIKEDNDRPVSKYVDEEEFELFKKYKPKTENEQRAKDIWFFSYYSAGMNAADLYTLRWKDVDLENNMAYFYRKKTDSQRRQIAKPVLLTDLHLEIIERHKGKGDYVFNFKKRFPVSKKQLTDHLGKQFALLRKKIGLSNNFSFQSARNSSFTELSKEATPEEIMEILGTHSNVKTLKGYIKRLNKTEKAKDLLKKLHKK